MPYSFNPFTGNFDATGSGASISGGTLTQNGMLFAASTSAIGSTAAATNGQLLIGSTGTTPALATLTAGEAISITNGAASITLACEDATTSNKGVVELATDAETQALTDTARAITPSNIAAVLQDGTFYLSNTASGTKKMNFDVSGVTAGNTRSITMADQAIDLTPTTGAYQGSNSGLTDIASLAKTDSNFIVGNGSNWIVESGATVRTSLGLAIGTDVQGYNAGLADIAGLAKTDSNFIVGNGSNWVAESGATARTSLGLAIGTDVQAYDPELAALAGLTSAADKLPYFTGSGTADVASFTAAGRAILDDADAAAQRTTLGLGTIATQAANNVAITGGSVTGITDIVVADGGSGRGTATAYAVICGGTTATAAHQSIAGVGTSGQVLTSNGAGALPTFQAASGGDSTDNIGSHISYESGNYYTCLYTDLSYTSGHMDNYLYAHPIYISADTAFTKLGTYVGTGGANDKLRIGLYDTSSGLPNNLIDESAELDASVAGFKETTGLSLTVTKGWYWLAIVSFNDAATILSFAADDLVGFLNTNSVTNVNAFFGVYKSHTFGALPDPFGSISSHTTDSAGGVLAMIGL